MTSAHSAGQPTTGNELGEAYEVLVSCCDDAGFDGDWRYSAFCPDLDTAMDGRTSEEAVSRVKEAIRIKLADYQTGQFPPPSPEARVEAVADFLSDGRLVDEIIVILEHE